MAFSAVLLATINAKNYMSHNSLKGKQPEAKITSVEQSVGQKVWADSETSSGSEASTNQKILAGSEVSSGSEASTNQNVRTDGKASSALDGSTNQQVPTYQKTSADSENELSQLEYDSMRRSVTKYKQNLQEIEGGTKIRDLGILSDSSNILSNDLMSAMKTGAFSDVTLKCGNVTVPAHKFILSARSSVFEAMFSTIESKIVLIEDLDAVILGDLLSFIYAAQVENLTLSKACDLMYAARAYQIKGLRDICTNYLRLNLSFETALQILKCADLYDKDLKADTMNYICSNFLVLKETDEWKILQLEKPALAIEIYSMVVSAWKEI
ncbi:TD and POZ domain-containing protein 3-like [Parasteatoda tepidariorum]|uniref:TD and POZ domain-containing protein 3-like n=1 Tax=Parasteatoda tepidariorum TaxID=114398 RepID=UPI0039BD8CA7